MDLRGDVARVVAGTAVEGVVAATTDEDVVAGAAIENVISGAAGQRVGAGAPEKHVVTLDTAETVSPEGTGRLREVATSVHAGAGRGVALGGGSSPRAGWPRPVSTPAP